MRGSAAFTIFPNNGSLSVTSTPLIRAAGELAPEVADSAYSVILDQVSNGVAVRMAVLYMLAGIKSA